MVDFTGNSYKGVHYDQRKASPVENGRYVVEGDGGELIYLYEDPFGTSLIPYEMDKELKEEA